MSEQAKPRARARVVGVAAAGALAVCGGAWALVAATSANASGSGSGPTTGKTGTSTSTCAKPPAPGSDADGYVTSVSSQRISLTDLFGTTHRYGVTSSTTVRSGASTAQLSAVTGGDHVQVRTDGSKAIEIDLLPARIDGAVTAVSGSTLTVKDIDGFTRTVQVDGGTDYTEDGAKATASALHTGSVVHAEGSVDENGTTLDADGIDVRTSAGAGAQPPAGHAPGKKNSTGSMPAPPCGPAGPPPAGHGHGPPPAPGGSDAPKPPSGSYAPKPPSGTDAPKPPTTSSSQ